MDETINICREGSQKASFAREILISVNTIALCLDNRITSQHD